MLCATDSALGRTGRKLGKKEQCPGGRLIKKALAYRSSNNVSYMAVFMRYVSFVVLQFLIAKNCPVHTALQCIDVIFQASYLNHVVVFLKQVHASGAGPTFQN